MLAPLDVLAELEEGGYALTVEGGRLITPTPRFCSLAPSVTTPLYRSIRL
jgi:hypothetical protein